MPINEDDIELGAKNPWDARTQISKWDGKRRDTVTPRQSTRSNRSSATSEHALTRENMDNLAHELKTAKREREQREAAAASRRARDAAEARRRREEASRQGSSRPDTQHRTSTRLASSRRLERPLYSNDELSRNWTKVSETPEKTVWTQEFNGGWREYTQKQYYSNSRR